MPADLSIQNAFLDGIEEVFSIMFTDEIFLYTMNEEETTVNVYEETSNKVYYEPTRLIGRVNTTFMQGEEPVEAIQIDAIITIPTKQLITHAIPHNSHADLETLRKGMFEYKGFKYLIDKVTPKTLVADIWQMYDFHCRVDKLNSLGV